MKRALGFAVLGLLLPGPLPRIAAQQSPPPPSATDRVPNNDPSQAFPRWMPFQLPLLFSNGPAGPVFAGTGTDMAVEPDGTVHMAGMGTRTILYANNRWETRGLNGFSPPFTVRDVPAGQGIQFPKMAVSSGGQVAVVWTESSDLFIRILDPQIGWGEARVVAAGDASVSFFLPYVHFDARNDLHLVVGKQIVQRDADGTLIQDDRQILHSVNLGAFALIAQGSALARTDFPERNWTVATDPEGRAHIAWTHAVDVSQFPQKTVLRHRPPSGAAADVSGFLFGDWSFAVDPDGVAHFTFVEDRSLRYRRRQADDTLLAPETVPLPAGSRPVNPALGIDARKRPNLVWFDRSDSSVQYATKVRNPLWEAQTGTPWAIQNSLSIPGGAGRVVFLDLDRLQVACAGETVHVFARGAGTTLRPLYTHTVEYNLGEQDPFLSSPAGPNASTNAATGNLHFRLPLFASRGAGLSSSLSLVHNTLDGEAGPIGAGWTHDLIMTLTSNTVPQNQDLLTLRFGDGRKVVFKFDPAKGIFLAVDEFGYFARLERNLPAPGEFLMTTKFGTTYTFRTDGKLRLLRDTNGNVLTLLYGPNDASTLAERTLGIFEDALVAVTDSMGRQTRFRYDSRERLGEVEDPAGATAVLTYGADGNLAKVRFAAAPEPDHAWRFEYHADSAPVSIDAIPDVFNRKGFLARLFTPKGNAGNFFHEFYYLLDGRLRVAREPAAAFVTEAGGLESAQAKRVFSYIDRPPGQPQETLVRNRRDFDTRVEYEYRRCLGLQVTDVEGHFIRRTFDLVPQFRNLRAFRDKRGVTTDYDYYTPAESMPDYVGDNLKTVVRKKGNAAPGEALPPIRYFHTADGLNRVAAVTDARGNTTAYDHDGAGNLRAIHYPPAPTVPESGTPTPPFPLVSATESFDYDGRGRVTGSTSANGGVTVFSYDDPVTGLVTGILRPAHAAPERFAYDRLGNTTDHTLPLGGNTRFDLDGIYRVRSQVEPSGDAPSPTTSFFYTLDSEVERTVNPRGFSTTHVLDRLGRLESTSNAKGETTRFFYDREGNTRVARDPLGAETTAEYDRLNRVSRETRPGPPAMTAEMEYDPNGNPVKRTEAPGTLDARVTRHEYDVRNNPIATIHPIPSLVDLNSYDENDNLFASQRREGTFFKYGTFSAFDSRNRLESSTALTSDPGPTPTPGMTVSGFATLFGYDGNNNRRTVTDPRGNTTVFRVDGADRHTETIDAKGVRVSRVVYNDNDLRDEVRIAPPEGVAPDADGLIRSRRFGYNLRNELKTATDFFGRFVTSFYDADSTVVRVVDEKGVPREFVPDELDRTMEERVQIRPGTTAITAFHYDARGNRDRVTDPRGQTWLFDHDAASRLIRLTYPAIVTGPQPGASHVETWTYNNHGEPATHTDALGDQATFGYDAMGRPTAETHVLGAQVRAALTRAYDGASNLVSAFDAVTGLAVEYQTPLGTPGYDALNRLTDVRFRVGGVIFKSLHYGYDAASNRETMTGPDGETIAYHHDQNNRMETLRRNGSLFGTWVYDSGGRLKETQLGNGAVARRTYDGKEQVRAVRTQTSGGALLAGYAYDYNERGERTRMIAEHLGTTAAYGYTDNSWLSSEIYSGSITSTRSYEYDLGGNRTRAIRDGVACTYSHDEENRLFLERCAAGAGGQLFGTPVASSTKPGHNAAVLADGDTTDSPSAKKSWRNDEKTPGVIFAGLDFGAAKTISEIRFFIPTLEGNEGAAGMQRFKIQVGDGTNFTDAVPTALQGAESSPTPGLALRSAEREGGWLRTVKPTPHEVRVEFVPLTGKVVRILMDLGPADQPKTMRLNEIQAFGPAEEVIQYFHDANGNQTKRLKGAIEETLAYDYRNLLANYTRKNTSTNAIESAFMYGFMPTGERLSKMDVLSGATTWSMYDGADVVSDYTTTPIAPLFALSASYVNALAIDSKVAHINPNGTKFFYTTDALGSATQMVNQSQTVVNNYFTTAWGEDLLNQRPVVDRYGFTQRERDDESSLMHFRARSYDPRLGRFIQSDPLRGNRPARHYSYGSNNPLSRIDPYGTQDEGSDRKYSEDLTTRNILGSVYFWHPVTKDWFHVKNPNKFAAVIERDEIQIGIDFTQGNLEPASGFAKAILNSQIESSAANLVTNRASGNFLQAVRITPITGSIIGAYEAIGGKDIYTGESLSAWRRGVGALPLGIGIAGKLGGLAKGSSVLAAGEASALRFEVLRKLEEVLAKKSSEITKLKAIDPELKIGIRGSTATGKIGNPGKLAGPWNPDNFDLDLFVQSDKLYEKFGGNLRPVGIGEVLRKLDPDLFKGLRPGGEGASLKIFPSTADLGEGVQYFK